MMTLAILLLMLVSKGAREGVLRDSMDFKDSKGLKAFLVVEVDSILILMTLEEESPLLRSIGLI